MPKFQDILTWQKAEKLMQPSFIRLIDNIRKQLDEQTSWKGTYIDTPIWSDDVSEETRFKVNQLQAELETASPARADEIEQILAGLPSPFPSYQLCLEHGEEGVTVDLWDLCYQICFHNYDSASGTSHISPTAETDGVEVDANLLDATGEVDWNRLDEKTQRVVEQVFADLPDRV